MSLLIVGVPAQGHAASDGQAHATKPTMDMAPGDFFLEQYSHLVPHAVFTPDVSPDPARNQLLAFYNVNLFQVGVVVLIALLFLSVRFSFGAARTPWILRVFRGWCLWIRDEMVYSVLGEKDGEKLAPYFIFLFFFIAFLNLVSLVPGSVTAMATVFVTGALALLSLAMIIAFGVKAQGVGGFVKHLVAPPGVPAFVLPIMAPVEILSLFVKPFALMVRLFANLLAGHMVLYSFVGMIFVFAKLTNQGAFAYATAVPAVGLAIFVTILESFIVILQAYVFTYLSIIFVGQVLHPEH
jgi:ATP synthase subunit 6